jgi:tripartite-type tricarboxylate transporter receptor subunit TctC
MSLIGEEEPAMVISRRQGVLAPAGTAPAVIGRLNGVINEGLASSAMQASLATFKVEPKPGSPEDFAQFLAAEVKKWAGVIRAAGIKVE